MKRWAILTVLLYALALLVLTLPCCFLFAFEFSKESKSWVIDSALADAFLVYKEWGYWFGLGVFAMIQAALLLVPVDLSRRRLPSRRKLMVPIITTSLLLGNLTLAALFSILGACFGDNASVVFDEPGNMAERLVAAVPPFANALQSVGINPGADFFAMTTALGYLVMVWLLWGIVFYHYSHADAPETFVRRTTRWLLRASILELLVAVPSHIIVRHRNDCCAPIASFWGIVTGLGIMLLAFGPGVFFLFARRMREKRGAREVTVRPAPNPIPEQE